MKGKMHKENKARMYNIEKIDFLYFAKSIAG